MAEEKKKKTVKKSTKEEPKEKVEKKKTTTKKASTKKVDTKVVEEKPAIEKKPRAKRKTTKKVEEKLLPPVEEKVEEKPAVEEAKEEVKVETEPVKEEIEVEDVPSVEETTTVAVPVVPEAAPVLEVKEETPTEVVAQPLGPSRFDGKLIQLIGWSLIGFILTTVTLGLGLPFAICFILDWRYKHTIINGKRLSFDGNGLQLWGNFIKWTFFTIITLGIFLLFLPVQKNRWLVKHVHYEENRKPKVNYSIFDGITWEYIGISVLSFFLNLFSLGLLSPFCETLMYSWRVNHTTYDTIDMEFDGKGFQLLGNYIKWIFLTIITLGIYGLWVPIKKIQWEVKHTHEKGYARRPYRPVLGMILPSILSIAALGGIIFGLTKVDKETWKDIKEDITHYVDSIKRETEKYDFAHTFAERVADMYYRASTRDINITWKERYERYFDPNKVDKLADNIYNDYFDGKVDMAIVDLPTIEQPALIATDGKQIRIFWLFEKRIENHYFTYNHTKGDIKIVTDKNGSHLAYVPEIDNYNSNYCILYLENVVDFNSNCHQVEISDSDIKISDADLHYTEVDLRDLGGFDSAASYYYKNSTKEYKDESRVWNEDEVNEELDTSTYQNAYISYIKNHLKEDAKAVVLEISGVKAPVLVIFEGNKTHLLSYSDNNLYINNDFDKASLSVLKKSSKSYEDYVLVTSNGGYRYYNFIEAYILDGKKSDDEKFLKVKKSNVTKALKKLGYKESSDKIELISISNSKYDKLLSKLEVEEDEEEIEDENSLNYYKKEDVKLYYGDYENVIDEVGSDKIVYSIFSNGSYSYLREGTDRKNRLGIRETGTYNIDVKEHKICMVSKTKDSNKSEGCFEITGENQFKDSKSGIVYNYTKIKAQLLN